MYNPKLAQLSYSDLFRKQGIKSALKSFIFILIWALFNKYVLEEKFTPFLACVGFIFFSVFFTWKPKFIRFLRGYLRGPEYRDRSDD
jgi:hypothetical protein